MHGVVGDGPCLVCGPEGDCSAARGQVVSWIGGTFTVEPLAVLERIKDSMVPVAKVIGQLSVCTNIDRRIRTVF